MSKVFHTACGTELPLLQLKGKDYLEVKYRLVWFREDHPDWRIETEAVKLEPNASIFKAVIRDAAGNIRAISHKCETSDGFADHMEKAETGAIGRALALIGFGTQFAPELEEGDRVVDSPAQTKKAATQPPKDAAKTNNTQGNPISEAQRKRLYAISKGANVDEAKMKPLLAEYGYESTKDIRWPDYETICNRVQSMKASG